MRFSVIIPNYNSERWIRKCLDSVLSQSYHDYEVIIVDDMSTDNSVNIIKEYTSKKIKLIELTEKRFNGGTRNVGVENAKGDYIVFIDCDDWFSSNECLSEIAKEIDHTNADCIRLSYKAFNGRNKARISLKEKNLKELSHTIFVAPWTKCIKRELFFPFPENSLLEDVVQHIGQVDKLETYSICKIPIIIWNRANKDAISSKTAKYDENSKRYSSVFRNYADLVDLRCKHEYCEKERQFRLRAYKDIILKDDVLGLINGADVE